MPTVALIASAPELRQAFLDGLRDLGYTDGQNVRIELRDNPGGFDVAKHAPVIDELRRSGAAVIVAAGPIPLAAALQRAGDTPVVGIDLESDPVAAGFAKSLARPGGNITGLFLDLPELGGKQIQLLRESLGRVNRVAIVWDNRIGQPQYRATTAAAGAAGLSTTSLPVRQPADLDHIFPAATRSGAQGMVILTAPVIFQNGARLAAMALRARMPSISIFTAFAEAGGLIAYGPDFPSIFRQAAGYVERILKGARSADLPIERPAKFELVVNLKTAKAIGVAIPNTILLRTDRVIQ